MPSDACFRVSLLLCSVNIALMRLLYATYRYARHDACVLGRTRADSGCGGMAERDCPQKCLSSARATAASDTSATAAVVSTVLRSVCRSGRRVQRQPDRAAVCCIRHVIHHVVPCTSHATGHTARCTPRLIMLRALHGEAHVSPRVISCALHGGAHVSPRGSALAALTQVSSSTIVLLRVDASGTSCRTNTARTTTGTQHHAVLPWATRNPLDNHGMCTVRRGSVVARHL